MEKIKSITLRNFKFFYGTEDTQSQNKLVLDGNHLLLYGENGSGKSSLYWALYTFLQSAIKSDQDQIKKYFDPNQTENLRNRFADDDHESGIEIEFQSPAGETTKKLRRRTDSTYELNCYRDTNVRKVLEGSDFINYKFLSKIYDFRNSEAIDLFPMFEKDILMFIDFEQAYTDHNGNLTTKTYASDWWQFITEQIHNLPKNKHKISESSEAYKRFQNITLPKFIELFIKFLRTISDETNRYLKDEFKENFTINFDYNAITCEFNKRIEGKAKEKDGKLYPPKIPLKAYYNNPNLREHKREIVNPHTFLNEARLTAIALAIRLAMLKERLEVDGYARILVLDDLLLSLDMSHRDKVLDIVLSHSFINTYQLMILSHDKSFYNLCKRRIQDRFDDGWIFKEVYQDETEIGIPCPFIPNQKDYLDLAKKYLKEFDYPASANYLRKEAERVLKYLLPENLTIHTGDEGSKVLQLDNLISNFEKYYRELGGNIHPFKKLKEHKDLLLNPLSHDNIHSPIYKNELLNVIALLTNLNMLEVKTLGIADSDDTTLFHLREIANNGEEWEYAFTLKENWRAIKGLDNVWMISNPLVKVLSRKNITQNLPNESQNRPANKLSQAYTNIRFVLGIRVKQVGDLYMDNVRPYSEIIYKDGTLII